MSPAKNDIHKIFSELIEIPTATGKESRVSKFVRAQFGDKWKIWQDDAGEIVGSDSGNLYVYKELDPNLKTVVFSAHLDTVQSFEDKIILRRLKDSYESNGSTILGADNKAGIAAIISAFAEVENYNLGVNLLGFFPVQEEAGKMGSSLFKFKGEIEAIYNVDEGYPPGTVVVSGLGYLEVEFEVSGKAAHAAKEYENGIDAIVATADLIRAMPIGRDDKNNSTMAIGVVNGGTKTNVVCDKVYLKGELRSGSSSGLKKLARKIEILGNEAMKKTGASLKIVFRWDRSVPPFEAKNQSLILRRIAKVSRFLGLKYRAIHSSATSDANSFSSLGYKTVSLGRGGEGGHTNHESIGVNDLDLTKSLLLQVIESYKK